MFIVIVIVVRPCWLRWLNHCCHSIRCNNDNGGWLCLAVWDVIDGQPITFTTANNHATAHPCRTGICANDEPVTLRVLATNGIRFATVAIAEDGIACAGAATQVDRAGRNGGGTSGGGLWRITSRGARFNNAHISAVINSYRRNFFRDSFLWGNSHTGDNITC